MLRVTFCYAMPLYWLLSSGGAYAQNEMRQPDLVAPKTAGAVQAVDNETAVAADVSPVPDSGEVNYTLSSCANDASPSCGTEASSCSSEPSCGCGSGCCCDPLGWDKCWPFCCCCKPGDPCTLQKCLTPCCNDVTYGGFFEVGYHSQNTGLSANDGDGLDTNDYPGRVQLQQAYFQVGKKAKTDGCCCDWGYQMDAVYGTNGDVAQSFGNHLNDWDKPWDFGVYGWALPQAYVDLGWNNWEFKIGHFYTPVGYEVFPATGNFFYSHSLAWFNSEPITHTGVLGIYTPNECWTYYAGYTLGWDSGFDQSGPNEDQASGNNGIVGFTHKITDNLTFTYLATIGDFGFRTNDEFGYEHTVIADVKLNDKYEYVFSQDLVLSDSQFGASVGDEQDIDIANYLFYTINDCWKAGLRAEWWKSNQVTGTNASFYELTGGVNYKANANFMVRPEVRYDWAPGDEAAQNAQGNNFYNRVEAGIDAIYTY